MNRSVCVRTCLNRPIHLRNTRQEFERLTISGRDDAHKRVASPATVNSSCQQHLQPCSTRSRAAPAAVQPHHTAQVTYSSNTTNSSKRSCSCNASRNTRATMMSNHGSTIRTPCVRLVDPYVSLLQHNTSRCVRLVDAYVSLLQNTFFLFRL